MQFQSLLCWNTSENVRRYVRSDAYTAFQSLLCWNTSENMWGLFGIFLPGSVSILVVLEYL